MAHRSVLDSSCLQTGLIPNTMTVNKQNTNTKTFTEKMHLFFQFTPKSFSSVAFWCQKEDPEASRKDKDAGSLTQALMLTDTDLGGHVNQKQVNRCHSSPAGSGHSHSQSHSHCKLGTFPERRDPHLLPCWVTLMPSWVKCRAKMSPQQAACLPMFLKCRTGVSSHNGNLDAPKVMSQVKWGHPAPQFQVFVVLHLRGSFTLWRYGSAER